MSALICSIARAGQETRRGADERDLAAIGEPGPDADHVLFGNADVDGALRELLLEARQLRGAEAVIDDGDDAVVRLGQTLQGGGKGVAAIEVLDIPGCGHAHACSSDIAVSNCT